MREAIRRGLTSSPKTLPSALLYDELGSLLFEAITLLPEYEVARVDMKLLQVHIASALSLMPGPVELVELGPGHGRKARVVLAELMKRQRATSFVAIDVAGAALEGCRRQLEDLNGVSVTCIQDNFVAGLEMAARPRPDHRRLVLFLGSNLSNFNRRESLAFLRNVRSALAPGDGFLLSADLDKDPERLLPAYDDALGVTAAFNKNVLVRLNRELGAKFDVCAFEHEARWSAPERRVEMHLRATRPCEVSVARLELSLRFEQGETIWTESSHRFNVAELDAWGREAGFTPSRSWIDETWPLALTLLVAS